jgi:hypothetical protein
VMSGLADAVGVTIPVLRGKMCRRRWRACGFCLGWLAFAAKVGVRCGDDGWKFSSIRKQ